MLIRALRPLAAVATLVVIASCSGPGETTMAATTPSPLIGSTRLAEDIRGRGVIDRAQTTISFEPEGRVAGSGGCNRYFGTFTIEGDAIFFSKKLGSTMMACPPALMDQERRFFDALAATRSYRFDDPGHKLVFLDEDGALLVRFSQVTP